MNEDEPPPELKTGEILEVSRKTPRIGPVAVWQMVNDVITPAPGQENTKIFEDNSHSRRMQLVEYPKQATYDEVRAKLWPDSQKFFDEGLRHLGLPDSVHDISVDRFTGHRLASSDYRGTVSIRTDEGVQLHPSLFKNAEQYLQGRRPLIKQESDGSKTIYFNVEDGSQETFDNVAHFGYSFGFMSGIVPLVLTYRYRYSSKD
jgi:hypothetical protein